MKYYYKRTEFSPYCLYTVGYDDPNDKFGWVPESDHDTAEEAADRVAYLNGSYRKAKLEEAAPDLLEALIEAKELIEIFHGPDLWDIYNNQSPEMKRINQAIKKATE